MLGKICCTCLEQLRQGAGEQHRCQIPISCTKSLTFSTAESLAWVGHPAINRENFGGENLTGVVISEELWNKGLVSVVVITWEANCYFSWWGWFSEASAEKMHLPSTEGCGGGREWLWPLSVTFLFVFSAAMTAATAAAICFCNCSSKASGEKAVLIVQITAQLIHRTVPSNLCSHLTELSN